MSNNEFAVKPEALSPVRLTIAVLFVLAAIVSLVVEPLPLLHLVSYAAVAVVAAVLLVSSESLLHLLSGAVLVFGSGWVTNWLTRTSDGFVIPWWQPTLLSGGIMVAAFYALVVLKRRLQRPATDKQSSPE